MLEHEIQAIALEGAYIYTKRNVGQALIELSHDENDQNRTRAASVPPALKTSLHP